VELERRRRRAMGLLQAGNSLSAVARMIGAAVSAVWLWRENWKKKGDQGLAPRPTPGRPRRLTERQRQRLPKILAVGAQRYGYPNDLWTARRIAAVLEREFGVRYHPAHVTRLLAELNWSYQKPERRALERNDGAIEHWKRYNWAQIKKKSAS
jgi:transposase